LPKIRSVERWYIIINASAVKADAPAVPMINSVAWKRDSGKKYAKAAPIASVTAVTAATMKEQPKINSTTAMKKFMAAN